MPQRGRRDDWERPVRIGYERCASFVRERLTRALSEMTQSSAATRLGRWSNPVPVRVHVHDPPARRERVRVRVGQTRLREEGEHAQRPTLNAQRSGLRERGGTSGQALPLPPRPKGRGGGERGEDRVAAEPPLETGRARWVRMQGDEGAPDFRPAPPKGNAADGPISRACVSTRSATQPPSATGPIHPPQAARGRYRCRPRRREECARGRQPRPRA